MSQEKVAALIDCAHASGVLAMTAIERLRKGPISTRFADCLDE
jgi:hypothetical protein